jgi:threonine/homoserine/homoserine lactone efflux protein
MIQSLIVASTGMISVGSMSLVILMLLSKNGWRNGFGYALGYTLSYALIGILIVIIGSTTIDIASQDSSTEPSIFLPVAYIVLGMILLFVSLRNIFWSSQVTKKTKPNRFFTSIDHATPIKTFCFGMLVAVINVKNITLFLSAVSIVHLSNYDLKFKLINVVLVTLVFCFSVISPVCIALIFPQKSHAILHGIKNTIETRARFISTWVPIIFAVIFLYIGITQLL